MSKTITVIGILMILYAIAALLTDYLLVYVLLHLSSDDTYMIIVPAEENSIDWTRFWLPASALGAILIAIGKLVSRKR